MDKKLALIKLQDAERPALVTVLARPSRKSQSRFRCHFLVADPRGGKKPVQVADIPLEMN